MQSMAKQSKKNSPIEPISVNKIYETIQATSFTEELWWELISDIQEKPTYQHLKEMVNVAINNTVENFVTKSVDANEDEKRKSELTEISIMTYTLDRVISEVLYKKYQNEFENIIKNLIEDILKGKPNEASNPDSLCENVEKIFDKENPGSTSMKENDYAMNHAKKSQISNSSKDIEEFSVAPARKRGRPKKTNVDEEKTEKMNAVPARKRGRPPMIPEKSFAASFNDKMRHETSDQESDDESKISVGNISVDSVSSVHTSELSSFEDTISICSDEEGKKKHISLKAANEMYLKGKLSQIYQFGKRSERLKRMKEASSSVSKNLTKKKNSNSGNVNFSSRKVLPQRIRKPNPKYNSETMYCDIKGYSSPPTDTRSSSSQDVTDNKPIGLTKVQRKRKRSSSDKGIPSSPASMIAAF